MSKPIPFLDLPAQHRPLADELVAMFREAVTNAAFIGGAAVQRFEESFARFCEVDYCLGVANGTDALMLALRAHGVGPGDKVVVPAHTFIATAEAVTMLGAEPVLVDVTPDTYTLDPAALERLDDPSIKAVMPVHIYGQVADMDPILATAKAKGWKVIEDAAQAHGATYHGRPAGSMGDAGCFSFYPGKNLGALGDGGALVMRDKDTLEQARMIANHGRMTKTLHGVPGVNSRLDAVHAGALSIKLGHLQSWNAARAQVAAWYTERLEAMNGVITPKVASDRSHVFHLYVVQVANRDELRERLSEAGIASGLHYPVPIHLHPAYESLGHKAGDFPHAERIASEGVSLPMFPELKEEQVERVVGVIRTHLEQGV
ncbi:MAG: DegT/DnrJ/EryC1/StrS family aminotransferase [Myxococcota bacterium]|nr:DegT/DnrJ/EryC1/StrS family aminotransferase [Myxococcota bacterium]